MSDFYLFVLTASLSEILFFPSLPPLSGHEGRAVSSPHSELPTVKSGSHQTRRPAGFHSLSFSFLPAFAVLHHFTVTPRLYAASWPGRAERERTIHFISVKGKRKKSYSPSAFDIMRRRPLQLQVNNSEPSGAAGEAAFSLPTVF